LVTNPSQLLIQYFRTSLEGIRVGMISLPLPGIRLGEIGYLVFNDP